jgi:hypothetical protein
MNLKELHTAISILVVHQPDGAVEFAGDEVALEGPRPELLSDADAKTLHDMCWNFEPVDDGDEDPGGAITGWWYALIQE